MDDSQRLAPPTLDSSGAQAPPLRRRAQRHEAESSAVEDASLSLLRSLLDDPLSYYVASRPKVNPRRSFAERVLIGVLTLLMAFMITWSVRALVSMADPQEVVRDGLVSQVSSQRAQLESLSGQVDELKGQLSLLSAANPVATEVDSQSALSAQLDELEGEGVVVTLSESDSQDRQKRVQDTDLRILVNALWSADAEGISINGERLGPNTAIRSAGGTILVNFNPIVAPYQVGAIGDQRALELAVRRGEASKYFDALSSLYGISVKIVRQPDIHLDKAALNSPKLATVMSTEEE
ncbi:MAG: DUF881 domain-containing protein [Actinomycetaceae bacterium]|nr:DUF881 domain-containing protein [Actinomycetaceae bacterium]